MKRGRPRAWRGAAPARPLGWTAALRPTVIALLTSLCFLWPGVSRVPGQERIIKDDLGRPFPLPASTPSTPS